MRNLVLSTETANGYTAVPDIFIDQFIPNTSGEFVKIYLYLLRLLSNKNSNLSISSLADTFNQTESDVIRALRYWDKLGLLELEYNSDNTICGITLKDLNNNTNNLVSRVSDTSANGYNLNINLKNEDEVINNLASNNQANNHASKAAKFNNSALGSNVVSINANTASQNTIVSSMPQATVEANKPSLVEPSAARMDELNNEEDFSLLLFGIQAYLSRPLTQKECNLIVYLDDNLSFSSSLIDYLFAYCVEANHKDVRYIEATALNWHEKGITSVAAAKEEVTNHSNATISVLKAFGISNRELGSSEKDYINRWSKEYHFSPEIIAEACNRSLANTHQASFQYADSIIKGWYESGVKNFEDISRADADFKANKAAGYTNTTTARANNMTNKSAARNKTNKFNNFQQREYSQEFYDSLYDNM